MTTVDMWARADRLRTDRMPFVLATVVRAQRPTSARPGDRALVLPDGSLEGFVGGACAEATVLAEGLRLLEAGRPAPPRLLRISPEPATAGVDEDVIAVANPCLSGGALEILLESMLPPPLVLVYGDSPVAHALVRVGTALEYDVRTGGEPEPGGVATAVVVASHGRDEEPVLRAALRAGVPYVALVASRRRAAAVLGGLGLPPETTGRVSAPAGLDIGARSASEIALSVYAELLAHRAGMDPPSPAPAPEQVSPHGCCAG